MDLELNVEKTIVPEKLKIRLEDRQQYGKYFIFSHPMCLPFDKDLVAKVEKGAKLDSEYFGKVLKQFIEDILPEIFPTGFYDSLRFDTTPQWIEINPDSNSEFQYAFNIDLFKKLQQKDLNIGNSSFDTIDIESSVFLSSAIYNPARDDPITNGYFPRIVDGKIAPVEGIEIRATYTNMSLPGIIHKKDISYVYRSEISAPIIQTLLTENPLFFPTCNPISSRRFGNCNMTLMDSKIETIQKTLEFRKKLSEFLFNNKGELILIAEDYVESKNKAGIDIEGSLDNYDTRHLYDHFHKVDRQIEKLREKLPADLGFNEIYKRPDSN